MTTSARVAVVAMVTIGIVGVGLMMAKSNRRTSTGRFASKVNGMIRAVQGSLRGGFQQQAGNHKETCIDPSDDKYPAAESPDPSIRSMHRNQTADAEEAQSPPVSSKEDELIAAPPGASSLPNLPTSPSSGESDPRSSPCSSSSGASSGLPVLLSSSGDESGFSSSPCPSPSSSGASSGPPVLLSSSCDEGDPSSSPCPSSGTLYSPHTLGTCSYESAGSPRPRSPSGNNAMPGVSKAGHKQGCLADSAKLGRGWEVSSEIGRGAMARINALHCVDVDLQAHINKLTNGRGLVVKRPLSERAEPFFVGEIKALRMLATSEGESPTNVLKVVSLDMASRAIVMERLDADLDSVLNNRDKMTRLSTRERMRLVAEVAKGLQQVHQAGLTHADIKPANVLVDKDLLTVKLADFGLSGRSSTDRVRGGTPLYMAPEATGACVHPEGKVLLQPEMDIYALGLIMLSLLQRVTGVESTSKALLYDEDGDSAEGPLDHGKYQRLKMNDAFSLELPSDLLYRSQIQSVLRVLLSKDPRKRLPVVKLLQLLECRALWATCEEGGIVDDGIQDILRHIERELSKPTDGKEWYLQLERLWWDTSFDSEGMGATELDENKDEDGDY